MTASFERQLERLEFLTTSPNRLRLLQSLAENTASPDVLGRELDLPRSTLRRNLTALEDQGYVAHVATENRYELTVAGELACDALEDALSTVELAGSVGPFFERFPAELPVDTATLDECDITVSTTDTPFEPLYHVRRGVMDATIVKGFVPTISPLYLETLEECIATDVTLEVVAPPAAYDAPSPDYEETIAELDAASNVTLFEAHDVPEYALGMADESVLLGAYDDRMRTHSVLAAPSQPDLLAWATEQYEQIAVSATTR